jgi:hypothetical protein
LGLSQLEGGDAHDVGHDDRDAPGHPCQAAKGSSGLDTYTWRHLAGIWLPVNEDVPAADPRVVNEVIAWGNVLREVLVWRVRGHDAQVLLVLEPKKSTEGPEL